jgi:hypothetical protein
VIIAGIRAAQVIQVIDRDKYTHHTTSLQNRMLKGFSALAALDQHEQLVKNQQQLAVSALEMTPMEPKPLKSGPDKL